MPDNWIAERVMRHDGNSLGITFTGPGPGRAAAIFQKAKDLVMPAFLKSITERLGNTEAFKTLGRLRQQRREALAEQDQLAAGAKGLDAARQQALLAGDGLAAVEKRLQEAQLRQGIVGRRLEEIEKLLPAAWLKAQEVLSGLVFNRHQLPPAVLARQMELLDQIGQAVAPLLEELATVERAITLRDSVSEIRTAALPLLGEDPSKAPAPTHTMGRAGPVPIPGPSARPEEQLVGVG